MDIKLAKTVFPNGNFNKNTIYSVLMDCGSVFSESCLHYEINKLIDNGIIQRVGRGQYCLSSGKKDYQYSGSQLLQEIERKIVKQYPIVDFRVWDSYQLNWIVNHQISSNVIVVDVEKALSETIYQFLRESFRNVLYKPTLNQAEIYVQPDTIIVQNLVTGSPKFRENHCCPLEKLLVDIVAEKKVSLFMEKAEIPLFYENASALWNINVMELNRYAGRRSCQEKVMHLMEKIY